MQESHSTCIKRVDGKLGCSFCDSYVVKNGKSSVGNQRYYCKKCKHSQVESYRYKSYESRVDRDIVVLTKEGCGIRSIGRILDISPVTVLRRILKISKKVSRPYLIYFGKSYQVDELFTYIGRKENRICIAYSIEEKTGNVIDFVVGRRNKSNLKKDKIMGYFQLVRENKKNIIENISIEELNVLDEDNQNLLHEAIAHNSNEIAYLLINKGINLNQKDINGKTPLHYVAEYNNIEIGKRILEKGGDINITDNYGNNAMWTAVFNARGNYELVDLFVNFRGDFRNKNNSGRSALDFALQIADAELLEKLR